VRLRACRDPEQCLRKLLPHLGHEAQEETLTLSPLSYIQAILSPWVALGVTLLIVWLLSRMALLSWADLSYVLPVTALGYVASAPLGHYFLNEQITPARWLGIVLIFAGTILVGMGHHAGDTL
jgi:drug/metabolite transporter (DMT)-like permease